MREVEAYHDMAAKDDKWHSVEESTDYLAAKRSTIYKWIESRNICAHKFGHVWNFRLKEISEWMFVIDTQGNGRASTDEEIARCKITIWQNEYLTARLHIKGDWHICH